MLSDLDTHDVFNQAPPLEGYDVFSADQVLGEAVVREGAAWATGELETLGALAGDPATTSSADWPTSTGRSYAPSTGTGTGSTSSSTTRRTTTSCGRPSATACTPARGPTRGPAPTWPGRPR